MSSNGNGGQRTRPVESYTQRKFRERLIASARERYRGGEVIECAVCSLPVDMTPASEGGPNQRDPSAPEADHVDPAACTVSDYDRSTVSALQITHRRCNRWRSNASMGQVAAALQEGQSPWSSAEIRLRSGKTITGARHHNRNGDSSSASYASGVDNNTVTAPGQPRRRLHGRRWAADTRVWSDEQQR